VRPHISKRLDLRPTAAWAFGLAALSACGGPTPYAPTTVRLPVDVALPPPSPRLVIVSIDGLRPDALAAGGASTLLRLASRGTFTWSARTISPSTTVPSHVSMLSGYPPSVHGITWDTYRPGTFSPVPTIMGVARAAGFRTSLVVGKDKLKVLAIPGTVEFFLASDTDAVASQAVSEMASGVDLLVVHFPEVDLTGHALGWMSPAYLNAVGETDRALGRIVDALGEQSTIIVTGDHGGNGRDHNGGGNMDMQIPWVAAGPGVPRGRAVTRSVRTMDTAATAARILGLSLAPDAEGREVTEAFTLSGAPPVLNLARGSSSVNAWERHARSGLLVRPDKGPLERLGH
jgi:arylsulfatase A-like enzyme